MAPTPTALTPELFDYVLAHTPDLDDVQRALIADTKALGDHAGLQISPDEGAFLTWITRLSGARTAVELGTFTGLSALSIARGLGAGGRLTCCDVSEEWTSIARRHWAAAGVSDRIELRIGPALETLRSMPAEPTFDLAFIDADKPNYPAYWEEVVARLNPGGLVLVDNVLYHGRVVEDDNAEAVTAIRELNDRIHADERFDSVMLTISDGLTLARRR